MGVNSIKFHHRFPDEDSCYAYLSEIKWEKGYVCKKCGNEHYCKGRLPYSRRCTRCKYDESSTAGTMFDKLKFSIHLAFHIAFKISTKKKGMSSLELSHEFKLRQKTCWEFKRKIQIVMKSSGKYPISGTIQVDEFYVGGEEEGVIGRGKGKKRLVVIALEVVEAGVGRGYARVIPDASSSSFKPFFDEHICKNARIITDKWTGYLPLRNDYKNIEQTKSDEGKSAPDIHLHIMNIKGWLRGIHHHCSEEWLQGYLDEYHFRFNRRNHPEVLFDTLLKRMVEYKLMRTNTVN
jgi:hypothetical protein